MDQSLTYNTITQRSDGEVVEKKSRFLAELVPVESEEEALAYVEAVRKRYYDARHHCFAYIIGEDKRTERYSDDGEPSQTAGKPMMDVLKGAGLTNVLLVVTRYFGGTLLGTGGLVRAYQGAAAEAVAAAKIVSRRFCIQYAISTDYNGYGKITYLLGQHEITPAYTDYSDGVVLHVPIPGEFVDQILAKITDLSGGKAGLVKELEGYL